MDICQWVYYKYPHFLFPFPRGYQLPLCSLGNDLTVMSPVSPKVDIFSFGLLMLLLLLNEEGPRHLQQMGTLLLSVNQTTVRAGQPLSSEKKKVLRRNRISVFRPVELFVGTKDINCILPVSPHVARCTFIQNVLCSLV